MIIKVLVRQLLIIALIILISGCNNKQELPPIAQIATPNLPDWIESISPLNSAEPLQQIRIIFKNALIPVESLDSSDQQKLLDKFEVLPAIPGKFRFLTPRMVGFQADKALPKATRFQVSLKSGLADLKNHRLDKDLAWTFNTQAIEIKNLPGVNPVEKDIAAIDTKTDWQITANVELNTDSVQKHLQLIPEGGKKSLGFKVELAKPEDKARQQQPSEQFDPSLQDWNYKIIPQQNLDKDTKYRLEFSSGILPAQGNLPSDKEFVSKLKTYSPLVFEGGSFDENANGRFAQGRYKLKFNNGIIADSAIKNIKISPTPKSTSGLIIANDKDRFVEINPYLLEPAKTYNITIAGELKDEFGQTLGKSVSTKYETGDISANIWAPSGLNIFPTDKNLQLNISTVNLTDSKYKAAYKVIQPSDLVYFDSASNLLPKSSEWQTIKLASPKNKEVEINVPLQEKLGGTTGMLAYGVQARTNSYQEEGKIKWNEPIFDGMVQLTNLGVFAQWFPESGLIRVNHLADGSPVKNADIEVYESKLQAKTRSQPTPCTLGKTDDNGTFILNPDNSQQCFANKKSFEKPPQLLVIARDNQDWTFTRTEEYSGAYGYGIYPDWQDGKPRSRGIIVSDRQLYQPGEKAWFTGFANYFQNNTLQQHKNAVYQLTLTNPEGQKTNLGDKTTNEYGTFSIELPIAKNQPLGYYTIQAKSKQGQEISGDFRVAEFKPPNFKVELALDKEFALPEEKIEAKAAGNYLFGSPVEGGEVKYFVTRDQVDFTPKGWEEYSFGRQWFYPEERPTFSADVLQTNNKLDTKGNSNQTVTVDKDLPYAMTYRVDAEVSDVSKLSVANSKTFTALPSNRLIGLKSNFVAQTGKPFPVEVIVTDPTGKPIENQRVHLELQQMKYTTVTQVVEGSQTPKNQVEYKTVGQADATSTSNVQTINLTANDSGSYRIRACTDLTCNVTTATDIQIWVAGDSDVYWGKSDKNVLELKLDKKEYKLGDTATVLLQSPYPEAQLYFAVIKDKPIYQQITKVKGSAPQIQFKVTPEMLPNAAVEAVLVRQGTPIKQLEPGKIDALAKIGFAPFKVNLEDKYLKLQATPIQPSLQPGAEATIQLELKDNQNNPTKGQVSLMVVNEAVLQLSGYRPPNLIDTVYAEQSISTRFSDNRSQVILQLQDIAKPKGWGYGGGFSNGAASTRIRKNFQPLAYYNGSVLIDNTGKGQVQFKLPDDLTTWHILAIATDESLRFGNADATFITTKPLQTSAIIPQFARPGDKFQAGLSVTNSTNSQGNLAIDGKSSGGVKFVADNPFTTSLQTKAESATNAYRFAMVASRVGDGKIRFNTQLDNNTDGFEVPLEVKPLEITERVVESGVTQKQVKIPLNIDRNVVSDEGGLDIHLASTLIPEIKLPAQQILENENLPFAEPIATKLIIAANLEKLNNSPLSSPPKPEKNSTGKNFAVGNISPVNSFHLEQLQKLQNSDGGFKSYPQSGKSDPWVSGYVAEALATTSQAFPNSVDNKMESRLKEYLQKVLANPGQYEFCKQQPCKSQLQLNTLIALSQLGEKRNSFLADIYQQRDKFDFVTQIQLAAYLSQFSEWQNESKQLSASLQQNIYQTGRTAIVSLPRQWTWMSSQTKAQAQALRLLMAQKAKPETIDKLLQSLLALRRNGTWANDYDNAQALMALVAYSQLQPIPPNFTASIKLANQKIQETKFTYSRTTGVETKIAMDKLPKGRSELLLQKSGQGKLHYLINYHYRPQGNHQGRFNGLRITREINRINEQQSLQKIGLYTPKQPFTSKIGQVYDIGLEIITDHPVNNLIIKDPLPAGFEAIDQSFQTATAAFKAKNDTWELGYKQIYHDRIMAYADQLEAGVYTLHYLVRSITPGTFVYPGAEVHLQYTPEEFGRTAESTLVLEDNS